MRIQAGRWWSRGVKAIAGGCLVVMGGQYAPAQALSDIDTHWAKDCIQALSDRRLVSGYPDGTFRPQAVVTRAEAAILMLNAFPHIPPSRGRTSFQDVPPTHWAHRAIAEAHQRGFFTGYPGQVFRPEQPIPRVQAISILVRDGQPSTYPLSQYFEDADQIPSYAQRAIALATRQALVVNYPQVRQLRPQASTTRGEMAALLCRALNLYTVPPQYIAGVRVEPQTVRSLPGQLNTIPMFNSNSPELVRSPGILLSTLSPQGKAQPTAHLDYAFRGQFAIFSHHIARAETAAELLPLYQGILLHNPSDRAITVHVLQAASYLSAPDAPFIELPNQVETPMGQVYAGPGSRVMDAALRGLRQAGFPAQIELPAHASRMLLSAPIPVAGVPGSNGRSTLIRLDSTGPVQVANLAWRSPAGQAPTLADWETLAQEGRFAQPRDATPTPLEPPREPTVFGRVAGISQGTQWVATLTDPADPGDRLTIPDRQQSISYAIGTLHLITLGTGQIQSAPMLARYADTAYYAHSNYGVEYDLTLPLYNPTTQPQRVMLTWQTPLKDGGGTDRLLFLTPTDPQIFFRGTVRVQYTDDRDRQLTRYFHLVQRRGEAGNPLVEIPIPPRSTRTARLTVFYPPDATPPQVLTITTR